MARSIRSSRTKGTGPEQELRKCIADGNKADSVVMKFENATKVNDPISVVDSENQKEACVALFSHIKLGKKFDDALKAWLAL